MLADLILALIERRIRVFVEYTDNRAKRRAYVRRLANVHADDPLDYQRRYFAGIAIQRDIWRTSAQRKDSKADNIITLKRKKS